MTKTLLRVSFAAAAAIALAALGVSSAAAAPTTHGKTSAKPASTTYNMYVTFYGWWDNSPPGCSTAYGGCASGAGTYSNPITFATDKAEIPRGTVIYVPQVEKYFVQEDDCQECDEDWSGVGPDGGPGYRHVDLWTGGKNGTAFDLENCESYLTQGTASGGPLQTPVIVNPSSGLKVSSNPLFYGGKTYDACVGITPVPNVQTYGQYKNVGSGECLDIAKESSGAAANEATCDGTADQDLAFDGTYFQQDSNALCLQAEGGVGSGLDWAGGCAGGPAEQWEYDGGNAAGEILGTQSNKCIDATGNTVQISNCTSGNKQEEWAYTSEAAPATPHK